MTGNAPTKSVANSSRKALLHVQLAVAVLTLPNRRSQLKSSAVLERDSELRGLALVPRSLNSSSPGCYTPLNVSHLTSAKA